MSAGMRVEGLTVDYGSGMVVRDVSFTVSPGEIVAIIGPNGAGKTSLLRAIAGLVPSTGSVWLGDEEVTGAPPERRARKGMFLVPDNRGIFGPISVAAHLSLARRHRMSAAELNDVWTIFPALAARRKMAAGSLSGGESQMLAIAMAFTAQPDVLLIDELSFGLAPMIVQQLLAQCRTLAAERNVAVVLVEQFVDLALGTADRAVVLRGEVLMSGPAAKIRDDRDSLRAAYLGTAEEARAPRTETDQPSAQGVPLNGLESDA